MPQNRKARREQQRKQKLLNDQIVGLSNNVADLNAVINKLTGSIVSTPNVVDIPSASPVTSKKPHKNQGLKVFHDPISFKRGYYQEGKEPTGWVKGFPKPLSSPPPPPPPAIEKKESSSEDSFKQPIIIHQQQVLPSQKPIRRRTRRTKQSETDNLIYSIREQLKIVNKQGNLNFKDYQETKKDIQDAIKFISKDRLIEMRDILKNKSRTDADIDRLVEIVKEGKKRAKQESVEYDPMKAKQDLISSLYQGNLVAGLIGSLLLTPGMKKLESKQKKNEEESLRELFRSKQKEESPKIIKTPEAIRKQNIPTPISSVPEFIKNSEGIRIQGEQTHSLFNELLKVSNAQLDKLNSIVEHFNNYREEERKYREDQNALQRELFLESQGNRSGMMSPDQLKQILAKQKPTQTFKPETPGLFDSLLSWLWLPALGKGGSKLLEKFGMKTATTTTIKASEKIAAKEAEKIGVKGIESFAVKEAEKIGGKTGSKLISKTLAKKIPLLGIGAGAFFGYQRLKENDNIGATGELASGVASATGPYGMATSLLLDAGLLGRDIFKATPQSKINDLKKSFDNKSIELNYGMNKLKEEFNTTTNNYSNIIKSFKDSITSFLPKERINNSTPSTTIKNIIQNTLPTFNSPLGIRINNPGNLRESGINWLGKIGEEKGFTKFESPEYGIRAAAKNLQTTLTKNPNTTLEDYIKKYAPSNENNTEEYIKIIEKETGIKRNEILKNVEETYQKIIPAMFGVEVGGAIKSGTGSAIEKVTQLYGGKNSLNKIIESRNIENKTLLENLYSGIRKSYNNVVSEVSQKTVAKIEQVNSIPSTGYKMMATTIDNNNRSIDNSMKPIIVSSNPVVSNATNIIGKGSSIEKGTKVIDSRNQLPVFARLQEKDFNMV